MLGVVVELEPVVGVDENGELEPPMGLDIPLAGWPMFPVLPPLMVRISMIGS